MRSLFNRCRITAALFCVLLALLAACGGADPTVTPIPATATAPPATATAIPPTATAVAPTATKVALTPTVPPITATGSDNSDLGAATWKQAGLAGEQIGALLILPDGSNRAIAAGPNGVWLSDPGYTDWKPAATKLTFDGPARLYSLAASESVVYLTNYAGCAAGLPSSAYRSLDGGNTWEPMRGEPLAVAAADGEIAYATVCDGVVKTADGGATWEKLEGYSTPNFDPVAITANSGGDTILVASASEGGSGHLEGSLDGGVTWADISPEAEGAEFFGPGDVLLVDASRQAGDLGGVYVSDLGGFWFHQALGGDWQQITTEQIIPGAVAPGTYFPRGLVVDVQPRSDNGRGPAVYIALASGSSDNAAPPVVYGAIGSGASWQQIGFPLSGEAEVNALVRAPLTQSEPEQLLLATNTGIWSVSLAPSAVQ